MYTTVTKMRFTEMMETKMKSETEEKSHIVMENLKHEDFKTAYSMPATLSEDYKFHSSDDGSESSSRITQSTKDINLQLRCRLCAHANKCMIDIFDFDAAGQDIPSMIHLCLPIMVKETDTFPKQVCLHWLEELERCYQFHQAVAEADEKLLAFASGNLGETDGYWATFPPCDRKHGLTGRTLRRNSDIEMSNGKSTNSLGERPTANTTATKNESSAGSRPCTVVSSITETRQKITSHAKKVEKSSTDAKHLNQDSTTEASDIGTTTASRIVQKRTFDSEVISATCSRSEADAAQEKEAEPMSKVDPAIQERSDAGKQWYKCTTCAKKFKRRDHLLRHIPIHSDIRELYRCNSCPKIFKSENGLFRHEERHTRGYSCKYCAKRFDTMEDRQRHHRDHIAERPHKNHLKVDSAIQKRSDAGEWRYRCTTCAKMLSSKSNLVEHNKIHSDVRELYKCNLCSKMFKSKKGLSGHQELHTRGGLYSCRYCAKTFDAKEDRKRHLSVHTG